MRSVPFSMIALLSLAGCFGSSDACNRLSASLAQKEAELDAAQRLLAEMRLTVDAQAEQIRTLQGLPDRRLDRLFHVQRIRLGRYTGGVDTDGRPGHDAVKVYLDPIDQHGSVIKAAGDVTIDLFDLPAGGVRLGSFTFGAGELADAWRSTPFGDRFIFTCPLGDARPSGSEVTVRVTFTEYLTGHTFTAQAVAPLQ
ncbi:MAG: hypothetical protein GX591_07690 [Planctomycetes bacterium]|nr:hypothetical protein [Planctomycetota bacterium]